MQPNVENAGNPRDLRRAQPLNEPLPATFKWIATLPRQLRPVALLRQFPRIANILARNNHDLSSWSICMDELLIDPRGDRRGFSVEVNAELVGLRDYFAWPSPSHHAIGD